MPSLVPVIAKAFTVVALKAAAVKVFTAIVINQVLSLASKALAGKQRGASPQPLEVTSAWSGTEPGAMVFGQRDVPGREVFKGSSGDKNTYLHVVYELARHQVEAIDDIWLDDNHVPNSSWNGTTGEVTTGALAGKCYIWKYLGRSDQTADTVLDGAFTEWTSDHRGRGVAYLHVRYTFDQDVYPSGAPQEVRALVKGQRLYDPRKDSTKGGSGSHRVDDPTTWEWSNNPTLCRASYLVGGSLCYDVKNPALMGHLGYGVDADLIDWDSVIASANVDDESVSGGSAPPSGAQARYTCDGVLSTGAQLAENIDTLDTSAAGQTVCVGGIYSIYSGDYEAPTITLTADDLAGDLAAVVSTPRADRYNAVRGVYYSLDQRTFTEFRPRRDTGYVTRDGGKELWRDITLPMTTNKYRAQRIAELHLNLSNDMETVHFPGNLGCYRVGLWQTVSLTIDELGYNAVVFRCVGKEATEEGIVKLDLRRVSSGSYTDPPTADYITDTGASASGTVPDSLAPPTNFSAFGTVSAIVFSWDLPDPFQPGTTFELSEHTAGSPFADAARVAVTTNNNYTLPRTDTTQRYYWIRAKRGAFLSSNVPATNGLPGKASATGSSLSGSASPGSIDHTFSGSSSATSGSVTVTPSGGTPGYTYAWTRVSGSADVSAVSSSAATTAFSVVSMSDGATKSATFRCTVTDSASATYTVDVSVAFARADVGDVITAPAINLTRSTVSPTDATTAFEIGADGYVYRTSTGGANVKGAKWCDPVGNAGLYKVKVTKTGGSAFTGGTEGSYVNCSTSPVWTLTESTNGNATKTVTFTIDIADTATSTVQSTTTGNTMKSSVEV
ncbi:MAG: hypothetical protein IPI06_14110 [Gammaproteobacteria bacterium]|nr:hypothetical protein [Gammaproteobacteria bacterium]